MPDDQQIHPEEAQEQATEDKGGQGDQPFREWAVLELMGHLKRIGLVTEAELFGGKLLRIEVLGEDGEFKGTQYYGSGAVYCMTPITEARAKEMVRPYRPQITRVDVEPDNDYDGEDDDYD